MTVEDIIIEWLKANGYDGLCSDCCGCGLDGLAPCCDDPMECKPAYRRIAIEDEPENDIWKGDTCYSTAPKTTDGGEVRPT